MTWCDVGHVSKVRILISQNFSFIRRWTLAARCRNISVCSEGPKGIPGQGIGKNTLKTAWKYPENRLKTPWKILKFMTFSIFSLCPLWVCPLHLSKFVLNSGHLSLSLEEKERKGCSQTCHCNLKSAKEQLPKKKRDGCLTTWDTGARRAFNIGRGLHIGANQNFTKQHCRVSRLQLCTSHQASVSFWSPGYNGPKFRQLLSIGKVVPNQNSHWILENQNQIFRCVFAQAFCSQKSTLNYAKLA